MVLNSHHKRRYSKHELWALNVQRWHWDFKDVLDFFENEFYQELAEIQFSLNI